MLFINILYLFINIYSNLNYAITLCSFIESFCSSYKTINDRRSKKKINKIIADERDSSKN